MDGNEIIKYIDRVLMILTDKNSATDAITKAFPYENPNDLGNILENFYVIGAEFYRSLSAENKQQLLQSILGDLKTQELLSNISESFFTNNEHIIKNLKNV